MRCIVLACLLLACAATRAQAPPADDSIYQAWGGKAGIRAVMDDFVPRLFADPRTAPFFKNANRENLTAQLIADRAGSLLRECFHHSLPSPRSP